MKTLKYILWKNLLFRKQLNIPEKLHFEISFKINTLNTGKTIPRNTISKINIQSLQDGSTQKLYRDRLDERINNNGIREEDDIETAWEKIKTNILKSAEEALGKINRKSQQKQRRNIPWYTEEVKEITREKLQAFLKYSLNYHKTMKNTNL